MAPHTKFLTVPPALQAIAEIVHDIDLKDEKFGREQTAGIAQLISGICISHKDAFRGSNGVPLSSMTFTHTSIRCR